MPKKRKSDEMSDDELISGLLQSNLKLMQALHGVIKTLTQKTETERLLDEQLKGVDIEALTKKMIAEHKKDKSNV
jgi:hypothetical protein